MRVRLSQFRGLSVRPQEDIAGDMQATAARDVDLRRGKLHPMRAPSADPGLVPELPHRTLRHFGCGDGAWRSWSGQVPVARAPSLPFDRSGAARWLFAEGGALKALAFYDWADGQNLDQSGDASRKAHIASAGLGVRYNFKKDISFKLDIAHVFDGYRAAPTVGPELGKTSGLQGHFSFAYEACVPPD